MPLVFQKNDFQKNEILSIKIVYQIQAFEDMDMTFLKKLSPNIILSSSHQ